jgi:hypothetical protein
LILMTLVVTSCGERQDSPVGIESPDSPLVLAGKGQSKGGGGANTVVQFSLSGGYETDPAFQRAVLVSDNKKWMDIEGAGLDGTEGLFGAKYIAMTFADKVGDCEPDQNEVDEATLAELIAQLSDPLQNRAFAAKIEKGGSAASHVRSVYHESGSEGSPKYRTELREASATEGPTDTFTLTGGDVWILKDGFGQSILCPFTGALVLTVDRG